MGNSTTSNIISPLPLLLVDLSFVSFSLSSLLCITTVDVVVVVAHCRLCNDCRSSLAACYSMRRLSDVGCSCSLLLFVLVVAVAAAVSLPLVRVD